jgi:hypothetical protein
VLAAVQGLTHVRGEARAQVCAGASPAWWLYGFNIE